MLFMARRSDHTRPQLKEMAIKYAIQIISAEGIHQFSARSVAKKMGYTVGTLYNIFTDCHDLVMHVNATTLDALYDFMSEVKQKNINAKQKLAQLCTRYWEYAQQNQPRWSALFESEIRGRPEQLPEWYTEKIDKLFELIDEQIRELRPGADSKAVAQLKKIIWGSVHGICQLHFRSQLNHPAKGEAHSISELIENVINTYIPESA
jgi:AcrR family transcriptional regulator